MSISIGGVVAMAANDFLASLTAKVAASASERLVTRGNTVTIPIAALQEILKAQARTVEQNQELQGKLQLALEQLRRERIVYIVEAPILSIRIPTTFVEAATASFAPESAALRSEPTRSGQDEGQDRHLTRNGHVDRETAEALESTLEAHFRSRMIRAYPDRELEFD
ncbi:hypothetical protein GALL_291900 [mine drainage metagenome]|uniref:Uncharacterized protein n=1 Tax=mine drainage metagenome TaxID=410659 RepID=A0A1J5QZ66_9ZZZZ